MEESHRLLVWLSPFARQAGAALEMPKDAFVEAESESSRKLRFPICTINIIMEV